MSELVTAVALCCSRWVADRWEPVIVRLGECLRSLAGTQPQGLAVQIGRLKSPRPGAPRSEAVLPTAGRSLFRSLRGLFQGLLNRRFGRGSHRSILRCGFLSDGRLVGLHCRSELCPPLLGGFNDSLATSGTLLPSCSQVVGGTQSEALRLKPHDTLPKGNYTSISDC